MYDADKWTDAGCDNPNDMGLMRQRRDYLRGRLQSSIRDRNQHLAAHVSGKRVLDIGCVDHLGEKHQAAPLHRQLSHAAAECVGVDVNEAGVAALRLEGYDVRVGDVTVEGQLRETAGDGYDIVIAGEIIEHITDVRTLFRNVRDVLSPGGELILTTPNPHSAALLAYNLMGRPIDNLDHVAYFWPHGMVELAAECDFELIDYRGERRLGPRRQAPLHALGLALQALSPSSNAACKSIIYRLRPRLSE